MDIAHNVDTAISHVCTELRERYPRATVALYLQSRQGKHFWHEVGKVDIVEPHLRRFCGHFPHAALQHHPDHPYGLYCTLSCHCVEGGGLRGRHRCEHPGDEPRAIVSILNDGQRDILWGRK